MGDREGNRELGIEDLQPEKGGNQTMAGPTWRRALVEARLPLLVGSTVLQEYISVFPISKIT